MIQVLSNKFPEYLINDQKTTKFIKKNYFLNSQVLIRTVPGTGVGLEDMVSMETTSSLFSLQVPSSSVIAA